MPSLARYIRGIRAVGLKEWWRQMQYIGDVKAGTFIGSDQCVSRYMAVSVFLNIGRNVQQVRKPLFRESQRRTGSARYVYVYPCARESMGIFNNYFSSGRHRWVDFAQVGQGHERTNERTRALRSALI